jgi:hypothetical protein
MGVEVYCICNWKVSKAISNFKNKTPKVEIMLFL